MLQENASSFSLFNSSLRKLIIMEDDQAVGGAEETRGPPAIMITTHNELETMSSMRVRFRNDEENIAVRDMSNSSEGPDPEDEIYRDLMDRYMAKSVSQADFFCPKELIETRERTHDTGNIASRLVVDENVPDDPNVPRIIIHGPDENYEHADSTEKPGLKKAAPLEEKLRVSIEEKRKTGNKAEPSLFFDTKNRPQATTMAKERDQPESSTLCEKSNDLDADLDIFRHKENPEITGSTVEPAPKQTIRRTKTDLPNPPRQILPLFSTQGPDRIAAKRSERQSISWLEDQDMLQKQFPGCRIILVFGRGEEQRPTGDSLGGFLGTSIRTVTMSRDAAHALRFSTSSDIDFLRITLLLQSKFQTSCILRAALAGDVRKLETLLRDGITPNLRDRLNQTALHIAVRLDKADMVHRLLSHNDIDLNVRDIKSNTPLHHAVRNGNETIIRALLYHGADVSIENKHKRTPRHLAEKSKSRMHIAKLLRSRLVQGPDQRPSAQKMGTGKLPSSKEGQLACRNYQITVIEIYTSKLSDKHWSVSISVEALLYGPSTLSEIIGHVRPKEVMDKVPMPYLSYEANIRQQRRTRFIQDFNDAHVHQQAINATLPQDIPMKTVERISRESSAEGPHLLQVPASADLNVGPYYDDSDSELSEGEEPDDPDDLEEEEKALIRAYLHTPPALHIRRTLDQYYYHMLESTTERDIDQVVSRWSKALKSRQRHNILMVDQLWLWNTSKQYSTHEVAESKWKGDTRGDGSYSNAERNMAEELDHRYVISCFPSRTGTGHLTQRIIDDIRLLVLDPIGRKRDPIRRPEDLVSRIMETCCSAFDRLQDEDTLRFFQMFEDSVGSIDDKENKLFREFQRGSTRLLQLSPFNKYYNQVKNELLVNLLDIREEVKLLVEIKDIRDELNIILSVLDIQRNLLVQMGRTKGEGSALTVSPAAEKTVNLDIEDFTKLDNHSKTIQDKINTLMDLKQKAANAWEAREARETAVAASKQGNTVLVFTVVTIVFLPLSFMSSFFAIGVAAFPKDDKTGETNWPLGLVTGLLCA
ncbi:hypothetical protein CFE70_007102 [Pyrenophora teres f. teres 0-1]